jgi:16S rRNA (guanine966-N2)-methyltransferase
VARIIAGRAGGRVIKVPASGTRPTTNRVRQAVFSQLEARLGGPAAWAGLVVADLYAGSGAYALEALSRGAARAVLVESGPAAARVAAANASALGFGGQVKVAASTVDRALAGGFLARAAPFDIVFLDPPWALAGPRVDLDLARLAGLAGRDSPGDRGGPGGGRSLLAPGALVVVERSARDKAPAWPTGWQGLGGRVHGDAAVHLAQAPGAGGRPGGSQEVARN